MTIADAHFLRGWLYAKDAPAPVMEAIATVIDSLPNKEGAAKVEVRLPAPNLVLSESPERVSTSSKPEPSKQPIPDADRDKVAKMSLTMNDAEIAAVYGCGRMAVGKYRAKHSITKARGRRPQTSSMGEPLPGEASAPHHAASGATKTGRNLGQRSRRNR